MSEGFTFLQRHAILGLDQEVRAFEFSFLEDDAALSAPPNPDIESSSRVLFDMMSSFSMEGILSNKKAFIKISPEVLRSPIIPGLDKNRFVFEIPSDPAVQDLQTVERIRQLRSGGYMFALSDLYLSEEQLHKNEIVLDLVDFIKVDISKNDNSILSQKLKLLKDHSATLMACHIETAPQFALCFRLRFELYQGTYMLRPTIVKGRHISPEYKAIVEMIKWLHQDVQVDDLVKKFEKYPDLTMNLLRFINSASIYTRNRIASIRQTLALIGNERLEQWLFLMLYAKQGVDHSSNHLFLLAGTRTRMMERYMDISQEKVDKELREKILFTGMLSVLDLLFQMPMEMILEELNIDLEIQAALLRFEGSAGKILHFVLLSEELSLPEIENMLADYQITRDQYFEIVSDAYSYKCI